MTSRMWSGMGGGLKVELILLFDDFRWCLSFLILCLNIWETAVTKSSKLWPDALSFSSKDLSNSGLMRWMMSLDCA